MRHAGLEQRDIEQAPSGIIGSSRAIARADGVRANDERFVRDRLEGWIGGFGAGSRIDRGYHILQAKIARSEVLAGFGIEDVHQRHLAHGHHHAPLPPADANGRQGALESEIEVPDIALQVLVEPHQLAARRVDCQRAVGVKRRCRRLRFWARGEQGGGVIGLAGAEIDEAGRAIIAAGGPNRSAKALIQGGIVPAVALAAGTLQRTHPPQFLAGRRVQRDNEASPRLAAASAARNALNDLAADDQRRCRHLHGLVKAGDRAVPQQFAAAHVECQHMVVVGRHEQRLAAQRHAGWLADRRPDHHGFDMALIGPQRIAGGGIVRGDSAVAVDEDNPVMNQRSYTVGSRIELLRPGQRQFVGIAAIDRGQGAEAVSVVGAAKRQPVALRRIAQHGIADRGQSGQPVGAALESRAVSGVAVVDRVQHRRHRPGHFAHRARRGLRRCTGGVNFAA